MTNRSLCRILLLYLAFQFFSTLFAHEQLLPVCHFQRLIASDGSFPRYIRAPVVCDSSGYVWVGTNNGLMRFDGYSFKTYLNNPTDPYSLSSNIIMSLLVDSKKRLWVGTWNTGLCLFDVTNDRFVYFLPRPGDASWYEAKTITSIIEDHSGNHWLGAFPGGVVQVVLPTVKESNNPDSLARYIHFIIYNLGTSINIASDLIELEDGKILFAADSGLMTIEPAKHSLLHRFIIDLNKHLLDSNCTECFLQDSNKNLRSVPALGGCSILVCI